MKRSHTVRALLVGAALGAVVRAQTDGGAWELQGPWRTYEREDYRETQAQGGFRFLVPPLDLTIRGNALLMLSDREATRELAERRSQDGLPTRGIEPPAPRRRLSFATMRERFERTLRALDPERSIAPDRRIEGTLELFRYLYAEGDIVVLQRGVEVMRCERLWISPIDDRIVVENAELRYTTPTAQGNQVLVVRGPRLVKQSGRWVGEDLVLTVCTAAEPHIALAAKEAEIIERDGEFEVVTRGQSLQFGGGSRLPLPDARFFTRSQSGFPIRSVGGGYSTNLGWQANVLLGQQWNTTGGAIHEWLTGRPAGEFRGDWEFGVGFIQKRGMPLEGALTYRVPGLYEGRTDAYFLDDYGRNLREIQTEWDGQRVVDDSRSVLRSQNRVQLGEGTHVDLVAYRMTDPAAYSEFFIGPYRTDEVPETSGYLHHADGNHLLTVGTRFNLDDFSYREDRALAQRFVEELPVVTYQWLAQPIGSTPWGTPFVLDLETEVGQRRSDYDPRVRASNLPADLTLASDRTLRADQLVELSAPFAIGELTFRPYVSARGTYYDRTVDGDDQFRMAWESGLQIGTRLSRVFGDGDGAIRHVLAPRLTFRDRFQVDRDPNTVRSFDFDSPDPTNRRVVAGRRAMNQLEYVSTDMLTERQFVRFEMRNLLQHMVDEGGTRVPRDFVYLDLAQDFYTEPDRDNDGQALGLLFYDLLLRPDISGLLGLEQASLAVFGDYDWELGMRTFDSEVQFGKVAGCNWLLDFRSDQAVQGALGFGVNTQILDRWSVSASTQRDVERGQWISYAFTLARADHDWTVQLTALYNPFIGDTTFRLEFVPHLGGTAPPPADRFGTRTAPRRNSYDY